MDKDDVKYLLGNTIYKRAEKYVENIKEYNCITEKNGVRHITDIIKGSGSEEYKTQAWLRENGTYISSSCNCPYNENGEGLCCKHIGALLLDDIAKQEEQKNEKAVPELKTGAEIFRELTEKFDNRFYFGEVGELFGEKWSNRGPASDYRAQNLIEHYYRNMSDEINAAPVQKIKKGTIQLEPELTFNFSRPMIRLRISDGGHQYIVKSVTSLLSAIREGRTVKYGKELEFVHTPEVFSPEAKWLLAMMEQIDEMKGNLEARSSTSYLYPGTASGSEVITGAMLDDLVDHCAGTGNVGGYELKNGLPKLTLTVEKRKPGVQIGIKPSLNTYCGVRYDYAYNDSKLYCMEHDAYAKLFPVIDCLDGNGLFFNEADASKFCTYVLPEISKNVKIDDPDRLLLNQIPLEPVVQFYLDSPSMGVITAHAEFVYGEDKVTPYEITDPGLTRDLRTENCAIKLLNNWMSSDEGSGNWLVFSTKTDDDLFDFLDVGVSALMAMGEVYLTDAFRNMEVPAPKISVGVSVHGSVLDLDVDTGGFPADELQGMLKSLHMKKRYHRLKDGRLLRLDDSLTVLDELNETLELSGTKLEQAHAQLPLYRAPSLDLALGGQNNISFNRDDAFRRISRSFHAVRDSEYTPPESLQGVLRKYQRDGYRWLRTLDGYGMGGILADDMGLGKTVQVLSYLLAIKESRPEGEKALPSLIVCPASLVLNWAEECQKFTPQLKCLPMDGDAAHRAALAEQWAENDIIVTGYDLMRRDEELYKKQEFYACILDEAQAIKNHTTQKYKAVCRVKSSVRFALTGTPVENRLGELWSIFSFLMPGYLPNYKSFCARFEKPIAQEQDQTAIKRLNQLTGPFILRRMKTEVLRELPPKTESVYRIELGETQRKLYLAAVVDAREKLRAAKPEDKMAVFAVLMRLREICCDPSLVADNWSGGSAKLDACMELVNSAIEGGHRILLFSQFTSMLEILAKRLDAEGISHFTLQGSTPKTVRAELVRRFNDGEASVFLISLRAGGTGLNLTAADIVIHYDPWWNVAAQNQATDRAYRMGQRNPVQVYKLIAQETIEEKIIELQQAKQNLADTVTGSADGAILSMRPDELLALLDES